MQYPGFNTHSFIVALTLTFSSSCCFSKSFYVDLDVNTDSISNVYLEADNGSSEPVSDTQHHASLGLGVDFFENDNSDARLLFNYFTETLVNTETDSQFITLSMPYSLYLGNYRIKLAPAYMGYRTNGAPALGYASTSVDISRKFESHYFNHFLGGGYKYTQKSSLDDSFDSYAGDSHNATLTYSARWSRRSLRARIGFYANNYSTEDTLDEFSEDLIDSVILGESNSHSGYYFDASYRVYSGKFAMAFRGHVKSFEYEENTFDNSVRRDTNYRVGGTLDYHLSKSIDLYVRSEYTFNDSNMETEEVDHNYHLFMNSVGMRIHF